MVARAGAVSRLAVSASNERVRAMNMYFLSDWMRGRTATSPRKRGKLSVKYAPIASLTGKGCSRVPARQFVMLTLSCLFLMQSQAICNEQRNADGRGDCGSAPSNARDAMQGLIARLGTSTGSDRLGRLLPDMHSLAGFVCSRLIFKEIQVDFQRRLR